MDSRSRGRARAQGSDEEAAAAQRRPATLTAAAWVQAVEAAGVLVASVLAGIDAAEGRSYERSSGIALTIIGIGTAVLLGFIARGVLRGRRWSRTPALLTQLFTGIVGIYLLQAPRYDWGIPAILLALAGFGTLLAPPSFRILTPGRADSPAAASAGRQPGRAQPSATAKPAAKGRAQPGRKH
ncbi:MAG: hypothetical protein ACLPN6_14060 [Streptosporangiaceae bacterium]